MVLMSETEAKIPMLDLRAQHAELEEVLLEGFSAVLATGQFVLGNSVEAFESEAVGAVECVEVQAGGKPGVGPEDDIGLSGS